MRIQSSKTRFAFKKTCPTMAITIKLAKAWQYDLLLETLFSADYKGKCTQADPDQNDITCAVHKIRISHESDAADKH